MNPKGYISYDKYDKLATKWATIKFIVNTILDAYCLLGAYFKAECRLI